ncbi:MAG: hypothetical protein WBP33_07570 [Saprospiraceae bacterium]|nr:hypothetical protein [Saprospiraceae bacterium]
MELNEKQFINGFNSGYLLAKYEPQMLTTLFNNIQPMNSYISGLYFGQQEFELEQTKNQIRDLSKLRQTTRNTNERTK